MIECVHFRASAASVRWRRVAVAVTDDHVETMATARMIRGRLQPLVDGGDALAHDDVKLFDSALAGDIVGMFHFDHLTFQP